MSSAVAVSPAYSAEVDVVMLSVPIELTLFCSVCYEQKRFVADRDCDFGLLAKCSGCGDERLTPFTRTIAEVA